MSSDCLTSKKRSEKEGFEVEPIKDNDTKVQVIRKQDVTDVTIQVGQLKSKDYHTKSLDLPDK